MNQRIRARRVLQRPFLEQLEPRCLLAGSATASWLGQDLHDLAGGTTAGAGNGVQDIHIQLANLPSARSIQTVDVRGYGGGQWLTNVGPYNPFNGALVRTAGSTTADLYLDPYMNETGRSFTITLQYDNGTSETIEFNGGTADANLRMPAYALTASWVGQDGRDLTGPGSGVGPDGVVDAHLRLGQLYPGTAITAVTVTRPGGAGWAFGINPTGLNNAEFLRGSGTQGLGDLYLNPDSNLDGVALTLTVTYADGKTDRTTLQAGSTNPSLAAASPAPVTVTWGTVSLRWLGQDGINLTGAGDVHLLIEGFPSARTVASATLSNQAGTAWFFARPGSGATSVDPNVRPLALQSQADPSKLDLAFAPVRDETGATLTLLLTLDDGTRLAARVNGGTSDVGLRAPGPSASTVVAHPGDDLNDLVARFGTVRLAAGLYPLTQPLVLSKPVTLTADPGATLVFAQPTGGPTWTAAIKVLASHTTLNGFAVRFAGPVRWTDGISYGPTVIGTLDNYDPWVPDPRVDLTFTNLDVQAPPASAASSLEEAPRLFRLTNASSGRIAGNRLKGGTTEFFDGPWLITDNTYLGAMPGTFAYDAFAGHATHDVVIQGNRAEPLGPAGKTWRFLVMTQSGLNDTVLNNTVVGIGMLDGDTIPNPNAPEIILTEAYRLHYEGQVARISPDGLVIQVYGVQNGPARTGDVLSVLSGPQAGQWRMIAQAIGPDTYVLDSPIQPGSFAISIATGFVNETYQGNTIDIRGSTHADALVLAGNQFGARVIGNTIQDGNHAFRISAVPTEMPNIWGWSHAPFLGATILGNTVQDSMVGGYVDVERNTYTKSSAGRVYFTGSFQFNTGLWTSAFVARRAAAGLSTQPVLVTVGNGLMLDPEELVLTASGNQVSGPSTVVNGPTFLVLGARLNGQLVRNQGIVLSAFGAVSPAGIIAQPSATAAVQSAVTVPTTPELTVEGSPTETRSSKLVLMLSSSHPGPRPAPTRTRRATPVVRRSVERVRARPAIATGNARHRAALG